MYIVRGVPTAMQKPRTVNGFDEAKLQMSTLADVHLTRDMHASTGVSIGATHDYHNDHLNTCHLSIHSYII